MPGGLTCEWQTVCPQRRVVGEVKIRCSVGAEVDGARELYIHIGHVSKGTSASGVNVVASNVVVAVVVSAVGTPGGGRVAPVFTV